MIPEDEVTAPWWAATRERRLLLQRCDGCGTVQHPPRALCTTCGLLGPHGFVEASGHGTVDAFTVVHRAPAPEVAVPFTLARVRLDEGPILLTHLVGVAVPRCDVPVHLAWEPLPDGRALPVFSQE
ncbi:putative OB-fold protein [Allocatelliglobosispora scoriae]|uniref:Putative OB-fold protein n=1 Tax=Allocatelliglobosispora scoriae TaxID=643052 RepID=A0A841C2L5_9ACTN|nr:Zn-ribbon domain-containing OB-fold protein [Allocatelliglobosispora scoriae]MBB5873373.1 putative OB-fold protein [Allocatelliglobosispora scoriae]